LIPDKEHNTPFRHFLAGSLAGNMAVLVTYPLEIIRTRLAYSIRYSIPTETTRKHHVYNSSVPHYHPKSKFHVHESQYGIWNTCKTVWNEAGGSIKGFYKGFIPTMCGIVPYAGAAFMTYESLKSKCLNEWKDSTTFVNSKGHSEINISVHLLIGGLAGMVGQTAAYPFDTVRHRMQLHGIAHSIPKYKNMSHAFWSILRTEGFRGFFIGLSINYWKTIPANAVAFVVYDRLKKILKI
jgi:solute carrier family 25 (mitochondrial carrier protein), member 16